MSDEIKPATPEVKKLPRVTCEACGITQAKPAMDGNRCRNAIACAKRQSINDLVERRRREARGGK